MSIENLAIYGVLSLIFSLVIGFVLAAMMDQKIRFENGFARFFSIPLLCRSSSRVWCGNGFSIPNLAFNR